MTTDANGKIISRCSALRFVPREASEQCLMDTPHQVGDGCRFASDARSAETHAPCTREMTRLQMERDAWQRAHASAAGVILLLDKSRADVRAELADALRHAEALRHALRGLILVRAASEAEQSAAENAATLVAYRALAGEVGT